MYLSDIVDIDMFGKQYGFHNIPMSRAQQKNLQEKYVYSGRKLKTFGNIPMYNTLDNTLWGNNRDDKDAMLKVLDATMQEIRMDTQKRIQELQNVLVEFTAYLKQKYPEAFEDGEMYVDRSHKYMLDIKFVKDRDTYKKIKRMLQSLSDMHRKQNTPVDMGRKQNRQEIDRPIAKQDRPDMMTVKQDMPDMMTVKQARPYDSPGLLESMRAERKAEQDERQRRARDRLQGSRLPNIQRVNVTPRQSAPLRLKSLPQSRPQSRPQSPQSRPQSPQPTVRGVATPFEQAQPGFRPVPRAPRAPPVADID